MKSFRIVSKLEWNFLQRKRKSGGARAITFVYIPDETVYLLSIYDKSDQENISDKELRNLIQSLGLV